MDPVIATALISALAAILVAAIGIVPLLLSQQRERRATRSTLETVRSQVQNSHTTNLRDELTEVLEVVKDIKKTQDQHGDDLALLRQRDEKLDGRILSLEIKGRHKDVDPD